MKRRFFLTILAVLIPAVIAVSWLQFIVFRSERQRLIDQQVEGIASSLLSSDLSSGQLEDLEDGEDILEQEIGDDRITTLVTVFAPSGRPIYQNRNAEILLSDAHVSQTERWQTLNVGEHEIRILQLTQEPSGRRLQVGVLLDRGKVHWATLSRSVLLYLSALVVFLIVVSYVLGALLLKPLTSVAGYLRFLAESVGLKGEESRLPPSLAQRLEKSGPNDEFDDLLRAVVELRQKLESRFRVNQQSAAQMAHELKTPLTIVRNSIESLQRPGALQDSGRASEALAVAMEEAVHLNDVISDFLEWARIQAGQNLHEGLHALKAELVVRENVERLARIFGARTRVEIQDDFTIFARPDLARQALRNLFENALKYSPPSSVVEIRLRDHCLEIEDEGGGIPARVMERWGEPFNVGPAETTTEEPAYVSLLLRRSGLGLARVIAIAALYGWKITVDHRPATPTRLAGSIVRLVFPEA